MSLDKPFVRASLLTAAITVLIAGTLSLSHHEPSAGVNTGLGEVQRAGVPLFSPYQNLEREDVQILGSAQKTLDVAMYAFTDPTIEAVIADSARRGVKVRIYTDGLQFADEESRASREGEMSVIDQLRTVPGVEIKIKGRSLSMHLKTYCVDGQLLRTGSANWSFQGETEQDNDIYLVQDPAAIQKFEKEFSTLWERSDNREP